VSTISEVFDDIGVPHVVVYIPDSLITQIVLSKRLLGASAFRAVVHAAINEQVYGHIDDAAVKSKKLYLSLGDPEHSDTIDNVKETLRKIKQTVNTYDPKVFRPANFDRRTHRRSRAAIERHRRERRTSRAALAATL
jgi:hypothetical protein